MIVSVVLLLAGVLYATVIFSLSLGWRKIPTFRATGSKSEPPGPSVSIVIAARNEAKNISICLNGILKQNYPPDKFEIIVVDDHSTDDTTREVEKLTIGASNLKLISLAAVKHENTGKKSAIAAGIAEAGGELIITTDADCRHPEQWVKSIAHYYKQYNPALICGPVVFEPQKSFTGWFMELEFMSLIASGAGALGLKKPLMCNGANMAFRREVFSGQGVFGESKKWASGDDVFLMHSISKRYGSDSIHFIKSVPAIVSTRPPASLREFIQQRIRWGSKTRAYFNSFTAWVALLVLLNSLLLSCSTLMLGFYPDLAIPVLLSWSLKLLSDGLLLFFATSFFSRRKLLLWVLPFQLLHLLYILIVGFMAAFAHYTWKGRRH